MANDPLTLHAVILAGGRGTRFWPRSRARTPKQLLNIVGKHTMLEQTVARLRPLIPAERIWTVTNREQASKVREQLPPAARKRVLMEPVGRNTAAAIALAALHVRHAARGDALLAVLPADHYIANPERYRIIVRAALDVARQKGRMVVLGIPPTRPETGFGYIERMGDALDSRGFPVYAVRRFTEKPALSVAKVYAGAGVDFRDGKGGLFGEAAHGVHGKAAGVQGIAHALDVPEAGFGARRGNTEHNHTAFLTSDIQRGAHDDAIALGICDVVIRGKNREQCVAARRVPDV